MGVCVEWNLREEKLEFLKLEKRKEKIFQGERQDLGYRSACNHGGRQDASVVQAGLVRHHGDVHREWS